MIAVYDIKIPVTVCKYANMKYSCEYAILTFMYGNFWSYNINTPQKHTKHCFLGSKEIFIRRERNRI